MSGADGASAVTRRIRALLPGFLERPLREAVVAWRDARDLRSHDARPRIPPPHAVKVRAVIQTARRHGIRVLVETGTYEGEMCRKCRRAFRSIITIELSHALAHAAERRLKPYRNVWVLHGDSSVVLPRVLRDLAEPAVFWLDGHFSGGETARGDRETPLLAELESIMEHSAATAQRHVILVDDARLLGTGDYPPEEEVRRILALKGEGRARIEDDILIFEPAHAGSRGARGLERGLAGDRGQRPESEGSLYR